MPTNRRSERNGIARTGGDAKAKRIGKDIEALRVTVRVADRDGVGIGVRRETLRYLLEAHDAFPAVLDGLSADFDQVVKALKEAAVLLRKGRP